MTARHTLGDGIEIDVANVDDLRILAQASSGGGKSWLLRKLLEVTYGAIPHVVIDIEGEFHTLREKYDYVLAGRGGDCPATLQTAPLLARRVLELGFSLIIDLSELTHQREEFVKRFLEALVDAPRDLWRPLIVVVDEAHKFCPEKERAVSAGAVKDLMTRGRKRGFCGVLATQRLAKLSKDAAAECPNKLIGRTGLQDDRKRAAEELGFTAKADTLALRKLAPGEFHAFGPALSVDDVKLFKVGHVETKHPKAGERSAAPTPPKDRVRKVIAQLADLPAEAEEEARTAAELREQVKQLRRELAAKPSAKVETKKIEVPIIDRTCLAALTKAVDKLDSARERLAEAQVQVAAESATLRKFSRQSINIIEHNNGSKIASPQTGRQATPQRAPVARPLSVNGAGSERRRQDVTAGETALPVGERATLSALIQYPDGLERRQLTVLTSYKRSTRDAYIARLREKGFVDTNGERVFATDAGRAALPDAEALPTGEALQQFWFAKLPQGEAEVLKILVEVHPESIRRDAIDESTGFKRSTRDAYLSRLAAKELVTEPARGEVRAVDTLFGGGS